MIKKLIKKITIKTRCIESTWTVLMIKKKLEKIWSLYVFSHFLMHFLMGRKSLKLMPYI